MYKILWKMLFRVSVILVFVSFTVSSYIRRPTLKALSLNDITLEELENAVDIADDQIRKLTTFERNIHSSGIKTDKFSAAFRLMLDFMATEEALNHTKSAIVAIKASQYLVSKYCVRASAKNRAQCIKQLSSLELPSYLGKICIEHNENNTCDGDLVYREINGACNNIGSPAWGRSVTPYKRLLEPNYDDGILTMRTRSGDEELPSPRTISAAVIETKNFPDRSKSQAMSIWGLFINYDMADTPASNMVNLRKPITCCTNDGRPLPPRHNHVSCAPISVPQTDLLYSKFQRTCMSYVRSLPAFNMECTFGPMEQMNQATHFLDGSVIYGSTEKKMKSLRAVWGGRLLTSITKTGEEYPPILDIEELPCHFMNISNCYQAGDNRINARPQLNILHTLFVREHNRIADRLSIINKHWDHERLYQESRKIVTAEIQHITYTHWLPRLLGKKTIKRLGLDILQSGFNTIYDKLINPSISNAFTVTSLSFLSSMIDVGLHKEDGLVTETSDSVKQHFIKHLSQLNYTTYEDNIIRTFVFANQNGNRYQMNNTTTFEDVLIHYWYNQSETVYGMDDLSINIQRGRDHGIPTYVNYRKLCSLPPISNFEELHNIFSESTVIQLTNVYKKVEDIDLIVGAISELPVSGAMVGPTLQCILGEQFYRTRYGDRFFYDSENQPGSFTLEQLEQIKRANLARIVCDNGNGVSQIQRDIFLVPDENSNTLFNCRETNIPFINLNAWKEMKKISS